VARGRFHRSEFSVWTLIHWVPVSSRYWGQFAMQLPPPTVLQLPPLNRLVKPSLVWVALLQPDLVFVSPQAAKFPSGGHIAKTNESIWMFSLSRLCHYLTLTNGAGTIFRSR
jgi:hypothetical protein